MVVFTSAAEPRTSTVSLTSPTSSRASTVDCCWTARVNRPLENLLKPGASTVSTYWPGGSAVMAKRPASSAVVVWLVPRSASVIVTDARGTAAPDGSFAAPRTLAVNDCPEARPQDSSVRTRL
jgi:hypothetical protein